MVCGGVWWWWWWCVVCGVWCVVVQQLIKMSASALTPSAGLTSRNPRPVRWQVVGFWCKPHPTPRRGKDSEARPLSLS